MTRPSTPKIRLLLASLSLALVTVAMSTASASAAGDSPTTPSNIQVDVDPSSVTVAWDPSTSDAEVVIYFVKLNGGWYWTVDPTITFHLQRDTAFELEIQAQDAAYRRSAWSDPVEFTTPDVAPVTTPGDVQVSSSPGSLAVAWEASASAAGVMDYVVTVHGTSWGTVAKRATGTTAMFDLPAGGDLQVTVRARDHAYRWSDTTDPMTTTVAPDPDWGPPTAPTNLRATFDAQGRALLQWDASSGGSGTVRYDIVVVTYNNTPIESTTGLEFQLLDFGECSPNPTNPLELVVTATSNGVKSPPSNALTLCFV